MKIIIASLFSAILLSCATLQPGMESPESQIAAGANALAAATTLATVALKNEKITVTQAKSYRTVLGAASSALDDANGTLLKCRAATSSTAATSPDPCKPSVTSVIQMALDSISSAKRSLDALK